MDVLKRIVALAMIAALGAVAAEGARQAVARTDIPAAGYGSCSKCSCPGFSGSGYTCGRGGCSHHYNSHW